MLTKFFTYKIFKYKNLNNYNKNILFFKTIYKKIFFLQYFKYYIKLIKKTISWQYWYKKKYIFNLNFYFVKRNLFFNYIKKQNNKILLSMTLRKAGFFGKLRLKKNSIFSIVVILLKQINNKKKIYCALFYKGLIKYKYLIKKILKTNFMFIKILYFKYYFKLPHNGSKKNLKKNRKKTKRNIRFIKKNIY